MSDFAQDLALQIPRLRRYARALTHNAAWADDLVQDTLERALRRRWLFRINGNLTAWLLTMLHRLYLNEVTRRRTAPVSLDDGMPEPGVPDDMALQLDMRRALSSLHPEQRAVMVLIGLEQLSYKEAAQVLDIPIGTVMSRLARARAQLRDALSGKAAQSATTAAHSHLTRIK